MAREIPGPCPVCGGISLLPGTQRSILLAVCDVLVLKALEKLGNFIVRQARSRYNTLASKPRYMAHTIWPATDSIVDNVLRGAWDVVPALLDVHGCCDVTAVQVSRMLDGYVRELATTGRTHDIRELATRFESGLDLPVFDNTATVGSRR